MTKPASKRCLRDPIARLLALGMFFLAGCRSTPQTGSPARYEFSEPHMGTLFSITLYAVDSASAAAAAEAAFHRVAELDHMMTDYDPDSELMRLCLRPVGEPTQVSHELFDILRESARVSQETGGAFDVTVGPFVRAWRAARKTKRLPTAEEIAELRKAVGYRKLRLDSRSRSVTLLAPNMKLDLGGIAKGYAADQALAVMRRLGIRRALVAASGDIAIGDAPPGKPGWKVGIASLDGVSDHLTRTVLLHNAGISTSGDSEQHLEIDGIRYSHVIDPTTGLGLTNRIQATIIGPNATITDGLDTPLGVMGVDRGLALVDSQPELAALIVTKDATGPHFYPSRRFKQRFGTN
jgi:thiamine biosynthesis lipoprotein